MQHTLRPYTTAGIAIVGASLVAVTPVAAPLPAISQVRDIALAAGEGLPDLMAPWTDVFNTASANATQLANNFFLAPGVGLQQFIANQSDYWQQILDDPGNIPAVMNEMQEHLKAYTDALWLYDADPDTIAATTLHTLDGGLALDPSGAIDVGHSGLFTLLPTFLPADLAPTLTPILTFMASPMSAIIMGALGPSIAPWVALSNSITDGDSFGDTIANMYGAYFNGATMNLDSLLPLIAQSGFLPAGTDITHLDFAFGGLLSAGAVTNAPYELFDSTGTAVTSIDAVGGSMFNSLGLSLTTSAIGTPLSLNVDSVGVGPIAAWQAWSQTVAGLLGGGVGETPWAWDGKAGGTPPPALPPLTGMSFPIIPDDFFDDGGASGVAADAVGATSGVEDLPAWLTDIVTALGG